MTDSLNQLTAAIKAGKRKDARAATAEALDAGLSPQSVLDALTAGMNDVGKRFKANELFVPEVLVAARAMQKSMDLLARPHRLGHRTSTLHCDWNGRRRSPRHW